MNPRSVAGHCPQSSMIKASFGRGPVAAGCVGWGCALGVGAGVGGADGAGCGVTGTMVGGGATVGTAVAGGAVTGGAAGAGVVCEAGGVRVQAKPMTASEMVRMTQGRIAGRETRGRCLLLRGTKVGFSPLQAHHCWSRLTAKASAGISEPKVSRTFDAAAPRRVQ